jgi:hypothetical protein
MLSNLGIVSRTHSRDLTPEQHLGGNHALAFMNPLHDKVCPPRKLHIISIYTTYIAVQREPRRRKPLLQDCRQCFVDCHASSAKNCVT